jgi:hypothetical protein
MVGPILGIVILIFTAIAWGANRRSRQAPSMASLAPVLLLTLSSLVQVTFIVLVQKNILTLEYSFKFAIVGLPICALALVLAGRRKRAAPDLKDRTVACAIAGLTVWIFLITLH